MTAAPDRLHPPATAGKSAPAAPFIVWPVARREFYMAIAIALLPALLWGTVVFGWRVLEMLIAALLASSLVHLALKRWTRRGSNLLLAHTTVSTMVMVALAHPVWPIWLTTIAAALLPIILWALGGPGRERVHVAVVWALLLQLLVIALYPGFGPHGTADGLLAKDRLFMGDIKNQRPAPFYEWPASHNLAGDDAVHTPRPGQVALELLDAISADLLRAPAVDVAPVETGPAEAAIPSHALRNHINQTIASSMPDAEWLVLGAVPGRIGTVSLLGILLGGLYLAYRYILRPRSMALFFVCYVFTMSLLAVWPTALAHIGMGGIAQLWHAVAGELLVLAGCAALNSDLLFAMVFILALPGTEPLTPRGRRVFVITAGVLAAALERLNLGLPAATIVVCTLMPIASLFDRLFAKRSWLNWGLGKL